MPTLNGIAVQVFCDGSPLEEYATSVEPGKPSVVSCWIASNVDKEFSIHYQFETQESCAWTCFVDCDGVLVRGQALAPATKRLQISEARDGNDLCPIVFSEMIETDSQDVTETGNLSLGLIQTKIWRVKPEWEASSQPFRKITMDESPIHESKKMLGGHRVKLGEPKASPVLDRPANVTYLDSTPYTIFRFYYRPLALLRALGHAPVISSTPVTAVKRSASVLSDSSSKSDAESEPDAEDERIAKLKREINARQEELAKITQKNESKPSKHGRRKAKRLKREEEAPIIVPPSVMEGVIDLCSD